MKNKNIYIALLFLAGLIVISIYGFTKDFSKKTVELPPFILLKMESQKTEASYGSYNSYDYYTVVYTITSKGYNTVLCQKMKNSYDMDFPKEADQKLLEYYDSLHVLGYEMKIVNVGQLIFELKQ